MDEHIQNSIALHELGLALLAQGKAAQALPYCEQAVWLQPDRATWHDSLGTVLRTLGRQADARAAYTEAIRLDPSLATAYANLGLVDLEEDRPYEALSLLEHAAELEPGQAIYREYMARVLEEMGRFDLAICHWEQAVSLAPGHARLHLAFGRALQEEGFLNEAESQFRTVLAIDPENSRALVNIGRLHLERGEFDKAEVEIRLALQLRPNDDWARTWLGTLLVGDLPTEDLDATRMRLDELAPNDPHRARLSFVIGQVLDAQGHYTAAAPYFRDANALHLGQTRVWKRYQADVHQRFIDEQIAAFNYQFLRRNTGVGLETRMPVFIVGLPRSGTTLIEQIMACHPGIYGAGELCLASRMFESLPAIVDSAGSPTDCFVRFEPDAIRLVANAYLEQLRTRADERFLRIIDKHPGNYVHLGFLTTLFPHGTIIHCRRDLRDVALSCWTSDFASIPWANDVNDISAHFRDYLRIMEHWRATLATPIHEVAYEETVTDLEGVARRLISAVGLEWDPACLEFHRSRRPVRTASRKQVRRPVYNRSVGRWKSYEHEFADLWKGLP